MKPILNNRAFVLLLFLLGAGTIQALAYTPVDTVKSDIPAYTDTVPYIRYLNRLSAEHIRLHETEQAAQYAGTALDLAQAVGNEEGIAIALMHIGTAYADKGNTKKALSSFIKSLKLKGHYQNRRLSEKLYYNMAVAFARIKQYPLALKYFYKSQQQQEKKQQVMAQARIISPDEEELTSDTLDLKDSVGSFVLYDDLLDMTGNDDVVVDNDTIMIGLNKDKHLGAIPANEITDPFDDGKKALAYGLVLHIKQPVTGKRQTFTGINTVGHTFITLTKFNVDSGYVSRTFGFYPDKDYLLSATPLLPVSSSVFRNDAERDWDELVATFISRRRFHKILRLVKRYSRSKYNLNKNNCTDFGLVVAGIAGIKIQDTRGSWPLGSGNNPADAGQSVREGKIEQQDNEQLFIYPALLDKEL